MSDKKSPWVWIGCGCVALIVAGLVGVGSLTWFGVRTARDIADPEKMRERGVELLGAAAIPAGYSVELALDLPLSMELVVLTADDRQFVYTRGIGRSAGLDDFAAGDIDLADMLERAGVQFGSGEIVASDRADFDPLAADWVVYRGEVDFAEADGHARASVDLDDDRDLGLVTVALLRCPGDRKLRMGIWRGTDPDPAADSASLDLTGSTGDPAAIRELLSGFRICG